jgi:Flp pilus assembly protein TadD
VDPPKPPSKAPWILFGVAIGTAIVGVATLTLAAGAYLYLYGPALIAKKPAAHSPLAEKARLPDDSRQLAEEAADHFKSGNFENAAADYQQIIDRHPDCLYAWSNLGVARFSAGDLAGAREALEKSVELSPADAFSWANLGITYYRLRNYDDAVKALEQAVALDPADAKSHNYLGCCYSQDGRQLDAEREFKKAIELNEKFGDAYFNLALVLATEKPPDVPGAKENYQRALVLGISRDPRLERMLGDKPNGN